jgi:hypothetical protein
MINDPTQAGDQSMDSEYGSIPDQNSNVSELPSEVSTMIQNADQDNQMYLGNSKIAGQRSFRRAVAGIEDGDYQGLEQLDFGAVDGTPAVSFVDEDGQRQVFRLTISQWTAALESRSRARKQLDNEYRQNAIKQAQTGPTTISSPSRRRR